MNANQHSWHVTEDEDVVPVRKAKKVQTVSRRPAAITGILIVVALGAVFLHDASEIMGQVTGGTQVVITPSGLEPAVISASPGEEISWKNMQEIPHYLISDSLCNASNECMTTSTMFTGDETSYTVPTDVNPGAYTYFSPTDPNLVGTISIGGAPVTPNPAQEPLADPDPSPPFVPATEPAAKTCYSPSDCIAPERCSSVDDGIVPGTCVQGLALQEPEEPAPSTIPSTEDIASNPLLEAIQKQLQLDGQNGDSSGQSSGDSPSANAIPGIPQNPYTVESDDGPAPITTASILSEQQETIETFSANLQKPFKQPNTGTGTWVAVFLGCITLFLIYRRVAKSISVIV